jgi:hypothetical protein
VLKVSDHGNEDTPSLDFLTDTEEGAAFSVIDLDGLQTLSHLLDLIFHFINIHLSPLELHVIRESFLAFFDVLPQLFHPSNFDIDCVYELGTSCGLAFDKFEHCFIVPKLIEFFSQVFDVFLCHLNALETGFNAVVVKVKWLLFQL